MTGPETVSEPLTPAEAAALWELLTDKAVEFVDNPYSPDLAAALVKVRAVAERLPAWTPGQ